MYKIGEQVKITTRHRSNYLFSKTGYDERVVEGTVVKTPQWVEYDAVAIKTNNKDFPLSIVALDKIVGYDASVIPSTVKTYKVVSGANTYVVTVDGKSVSCNCVGFQFRRRCKHLEMYKVK